MEALTTWSRIQALVWTPALLLCTCLDEAWILTWRIPIALLIICSTVSLVAVLKAGRSPANATTLARALLLVPLLFTHIPSAWICWVLAVFIASLDMVDGAIARHLGPTPAGAILDMETDQLTVTTFALLLVSAGSGPQVLLLPLMRPAFVLGAWLYKLPATNPKPIDGDNSRGRRVCAIVMIALLAAMAPGMNSMLRETFTASAALLLMWSFSSDWQFLMRSRKAAMEHHELH